MSKKLSKLSKLNGIAKVELLRGKENDDYKVYINNMRQGELLQSIIQLTIALNNSTEELLENVIGSIYQGCLTKDELDRLQEEVNDENKAINSFNKALNSQGV